MDFPKFLLVRLLLSLLTAASYSATSWDDRDFLKTCSSHRCSKHGPEIRFPFRLSTRPSSCGAPGMQLSCSGHDTVLDHLVLGACKVTAIYYRYGVMNVIPLADLSSRCPLQKLISTNQSTDLYKPIANEDSVLVGCPTDFEAGSQDGIVGPSPCLSLNNNARQSWYLVAPETDMSTLPKGCKVVANGIPIPYTYDKNGRRYYTPIFYKSLFKEKAYKTINFGETSFNWSLNNITRACQRCEQEGQHCGFSSNRRQAFCLHPGIVFPAQVPSVVVFHFKLYQNRCRVIKWCTFWDHNKTVESPMDLSLQKFSHKMQVLNNQGDKFTFVKFSYKQEKIHKTHLHKDRAIISKVKGGLIMKACIHFKWHPMG